MKESAPFVDADFLLLNSLSCLLSCWSGFDLDLSVSKQRNFGKLTSQMVRASSLFHQDYMVHPSKLFSHHCTHFGEAIEAALDTDYFGLAARLRLVSRDSNWHG